MSAETGAATKVLPASMRSHWFNAENYSADSRWHDFDPARTALVLVDVINWQVNPAGATLQSLRDGGAVQEAEYLSQRYAQVMLPRLQKVVRAARVTGVQVVHARLASRHRDYRDIVPALQPYVRAAQAMDGSWQTQVVPELGLDAADFSVIKTGSGAFTGSDLDFLLRRLNITTVLYAGVVTNACVMLSVAAGFDLGYRQYLIADCTGALSERDQLDAERFINFYLAEVVSADEVQGVLDTHAV